MDSQKTGVVAAGHEVTARAAADVLREGGNAFDAVVAGLLTSCVPEVVFSSLGGGGFLMAYIAERNEAVLYDFFAQTPQQKCVPADLHFYGIHADFGPATQEFHIGVGSAAVPGFVPGLFAVHEDLCTLPMSRLVEPAISVARDGVEVSELQAYLFTIIEPVLTANDQTRNYFEPNGVLLKAGDIYLNPQMADTFDAIAREGLRLFTEGDVAQSVSTMSKENGGHLTLDDLKSYQVIQRKPLTWAYRGNTISLNPAPAASGPLIAFGLGLLENIVSDGGKLGPIDLVTVMDATNRARQGSEGTIEQIANQELITHHLRELSNHKPSYRGTTHISVIDKYGNAASATVSNGEGNGLIVDDFGFMLNNMLGEEDLNPGGFHTWQPNSRLSTMMAPTIIKGANGSVTALGSGGSNRIRTAVLQVISHLIDHGQTLKEAVNAPRIHLEKCGTMSFEDYFSEPDRAALLEAFEGAELWPEQNLFFGGVHSAQRLSDGSFEGAGDPRRHGASLVV